MPGLGIKSSGRVPVAQLDSSSGFLIRRSQVRILPGTPTDPAQHETRGGFDAFRPNTTAYRSSAEGRSGVQGGNDEAFGGSREAPGHPERQGNGIFAH